MGKWVYTFGDGAAEGDASQRDLLGGKGANLAEMASLGLPVPPGMTITTEVCTYFYEHDETYPPELEGEVDAALDQIAASTGRTFGNPDLPLLVSVRSGARISMPGMMDTVLNLGLNDATVDALARNAGDERFAVDSYRRFIQMYGDVVLGVEMKHFDHELEGLKDQRGVELDTELSPDDWRGLIETYKGLVQQHTGKPFPQDPRDQLWGAIGAVFGSWRNDRAITYRRLHQIPERWGTAVTVQAMVFGNMGDTSATGVAFTRNPSTGEKALYGEFLINAQGGGRRRRHPHPAGHHGEGAPRGRLREALARTLAARGVRRLPRRLRQARGALPRRAGPRVHHRARASCGCCRPAPAKRTAKAALKIAVDMVDEGIISQDEAVKRIEPASLDQLLHPTIDPEAKTTLFAKALPASPGAAAGEIVFSSEEAERLANAGRPCILCRIETSPEDISGMHAAGGIFTTRGGMTSHAAVVARGMGKPCVSGAGGVRIDYGAGTITANGVTLKTGEFITIDGGTGEVLIGEVPMLKPELSGDFQRIMRWADAARRMKVRTNADTPHDARTAREFGAEGIGLCRTEHMFFDPARINAMREMILADDTAGRRAALDKILPMQRDDFAQLFEIMAGLPVTIRLLDPPLHEFIPHSDEEIEEVAASLGVDPEKLRNRARALAEFNPMLGHRGVRLAISYPEVAEMQARAIFEAAIAAAQKTGAPIIPEVMIPLVSLKSELDFVKKRIDATAKAVSEETGQTFEYQVGTMVELPRAALNADKIAESAEFFSFGTNDLTQTTFGISRDDAGVFLGAYLRESIIDVDPFVSIDVDGVGELVRIAAEKGRATRPDIKLGICGEHGGDPASIAFCETVLLDYVSCSPFRVPIARLAAAQAALESA